MTNSNQNEDPYNLINFDLSDVLKTEDMVIMECEQVIRKKNSTIYQSQDTKFTDPVGYIDDDYEPYDYQSYSCVKEQFLKSKDNGNDFYNNVLFYASIEDPNAFQILKEYKSVFLKRFGVFDYPV